jgi:3',5'-cyclic AMP phosphodiesterase CpdA
LNILHLSDLHFRGAEDHDAQIVLSALNAAVGQFLNKGNSIDLVIFSGDLVQRQSSPKAPHSTFRGGISMGLT